VKLHITLIYRVGCINSGFIMTHSVAAARQILIHDASLKSLLIQPLDPSSWSCGPHCRMKNISVVASGAAGVRHTALRKTHAMAFLLRSRKVPGSNLDSRTTNIFSPSRIVS
jgi:hypothetical protein